MEKIKSQESVPIYEISLKGAYNSASEVEMFFEGLKKLGIYNKDYVYSGFNAEDIGVKKHSDTAKDMIFVVSEDEMRSDTNPPENNPLNYAFDYEDPAVAVYDRNKLDTGKLEIYVKDNSALIAIVKIKT